MVTAPDGTPLVGVRSATDPKDRRTVVAALPRLPAPGTYRVTYRVLSIDGHPVGGEIRFGYREASGSLAAARGGPGSGAPTVAAVVPRAVAAGGALAVAGLFGYLLVVVAAARRSLPDESAPSWPARPSPGSGSRCSSRRPAASWVDCSPRSTRSARPPAPSGSVTWHRC